MNPAFLPALLRAAVIGLACGVPLLILTGCQDVAVRPRALKPLTISAASDLTYAFRELGQQFTAETGQPVVFNFGSTGQLSQQIEQGAPVDLFAAADVRFIDDLVRQGLVIVDTRQVYARGRIVLWQRADSALKLTQIGDLARTDVARIAIANPDHAPYGIAARQALQNAGIGRPYSRSSCWAKTCGRRCNTPRRATSTSPSWRCR